MEKLTAHLQDTQKISSQVGLPKVGVKIRNPNVEIRNYLSYLKQNCFEIRASKFVFIPILGNLAHYAFSFCWKLSREENREMHTFEVDGVVYPLKPVNPDNPTWEIQINGQVVPDVKTLTAVNPQMGIGFGYGESPAGPYNQGRLVNRGGAVIATTIPIEGSWHFLALRQKRPLLGPNPILEFPRGQAIADESAIDTARRQFLEEAGLDISEDDFIYLGRSNPDSALIHGTPIHAWWLKLPSKYVSVENGQPVVKPEHEMEARTKAWENIIKSEVVPLDEFESPSMMTDWAAGRVRQRLHQEWIRSWQFVD